MSHGAGPLFLGVDAAGTILAEHIAGYEVLTPAPLWAEQWPQVWLEGLSAAVRGALTAPGVDPGRVAAMAVSSLYGGSGVPVDAALEPVRPCLIWLDRRARAESDWVRAALPVDRLVEVTGNGVDSYYGFTKILWLQRHEPDNWAKTRYLLPPNAFLIQRLTGALAVDHSSAGNIGGVYDIRERAWSAETCGLLGIPIQRFPERLVASHEVVGRLHAEGARLTGLPEGVPVCAGGVDAAAATLSAGVLGEGRHVAMMGTSMCWGFAHHSRPTEAGLVSMPYVLLPEELTYTFGGSATAGAVPKWFRDQLGGVETAVEQWSSDVGGPDAYAQLDARAATVPPGSDGLLVLPYLMGERSPVWDPDARGTITGLTLYHTRAHLYRACLEGVAFALRHNVEAGRAAGYPLDDLLHVVGGGARSRLWLEILASVVGLPLVAAQGGEAAFG
ncbi:MAG: FGGY-family carbohydrate kinase, partial [Egibacteraceae bacterium]